MDREGNPLGIVRDIRIWPYNQMHKPESVLENEMHKLYRILRYKQITKSQPARRLDVDITNKKEKKKRKKVPIVIGAFRTVPNGLESELEELKIGGRIGTI